jgi:hypothetical protein
MERNRLFYEANRDELLRQYPDQWVANFDAQVVGLVRGRSTSKCSWTRCRSLPRR